MRLRLKPRDSSILDLLTALAQHLPSTADLLAQLVAAPTAARAELAARLGAAEQAADESAHAVLHSLAETFVTPLDREDIARLTASLDDCVDLLEEVGDRVVSFRVGELPAGVVAQVDAIQRCAELTSDAVPRLRTMANLREYWVELNSIENAAGIMHRAVLSTIFDGTSPAGRDAVEVLKLKEITDGLERAVNAFERVAAVIETIAIKEA